MPTLSGSLNVTGSVNVTGSFTLNGNIITSGSITSNGSTVVTAVSTGSFAVTGSNTFNGNQIITGSLTVTGSTIITGSLTVSGSGTLTNIGPFVQTGATQMTGPLNQSGSLKIGYSGSNYSTFQVSKNIFNYDDVFMTSGTDGQSHSDFIYIQTQPTATSNLIGISTQGKIDIYADKAAFRSNAAGGSRVEITGSLNVAGGVTASLQGTASYAAVNLQQVTNLGSTTTNNINVNSVSVWDSAQSEYINIGTTDGGLRVSGSDISLTAQADNITFGQIGLRLVTIGASFVTGSKQYELPNQSGTVALTTGSIFGTASYADRSGVANKLKTANIAGGGTFYPLIGSNYTGDVDVYAISSPNYKYDLGINQLVVSSISASFTGSLRGTGSYALQALSASYAPGSSAFPYTGNALISGSLAVSGSLTLPTIPDVSTGYINMLSYGGIRIRDNDFYEMKLTVDNPSGNSSAVSPGFMVMSGVGGYGINTTVASSTLGETESTINFSGPANSRIQSSQQLILSGSSSKLILSGSTANITGSFNVKGNTTISGSTTIDTILTLTPRTTTPTGIASGSIIVSGSATGIKPYFWNGATWTAMF